MQEEKGNTATVIIFVIIAVIILGVYFAYQGYLASSNSRKPVACTMEAKICPDGSSVGRTGPNCEFSPCPAGIVYKNDEYGFEMTFPDSWKDYSVSEQNWEGHVIDNYQQTYSGPLILMKNSELQSKYRFAGIPIMVFTPEVWKMVSGPNASVAVSAAPIGPSKIGENSKYVFATPPRYIGFGDDLNADQINEIYKIVETFKAF